MVEGKAVEARGHVPDDSFQLLLDVQAAANAIQQLAGRLVADRNLKAVRA